MKNENKSLFEILELPEGAPSEAIRTAFKEKIANVEKNKNLNNHINALAKNQNTALHIGADTSDADMINYLIQHNADLNLQNDQGETALHRAAKHVSPQIIKLLTEAGADITVINKDGFTPYQVLEQTFKSRFDKLGKRWKKVDDERKSESTYERSFTQQGQATTRLWRFLGDGLDTLKENYAKATKAFDDANLKKEIKKYTVCS